MMLRRPVECTPDYGVFGDPPAGRRASDARPPCRKGLPRAFWVGYQAPRPRWARPISELSAQRRLAGPGRKGAWSHRLPGVSFSLQRCYCGAPHRPQQVRSDRRPRQERHRHSAGRCRGSLRLHDLDSPRLRELRRAAGEPRADEQELRERGEALCEQIDLRQAGIRDLLSY